MAGSSPVVSTSTTAKRLASATRGASRAPAASRAAGVRRRARRDGHAPSVGGRSSGPMPRRTARRDMCEGAVRRWFLFGTRESSGTEGARWRQVSHFAHNSRADVLHNGETIGAECSTRLVRSRAKGPRTERRIDVERTCRALGGVLLALVLTAGAAGVSGAVAGAPGVLPESERRTTRRPSSRRVWASRECTPGWPGPFRGA